MPKTAAPAAPSTAPPLPGGRFPEIADELEALAAAGNGAAAFRLAEVLGTCPSEPMPSRGRFADELVEGLAQLGSGLRIGGMQSHEPGVVEALLVAHEHLSELCDGVDGLDPVAARAEASDWLAQAAALGHPPALLAQADALIDRYRTRGDLIDNAEELRELRRQSMAMLQRALDAGVPEALMRMARAAATGDLAARDPAAAYAYLLAYRDVPGRKPVPRAMLDRQLQTLASPLTDAEVRHAEVLAAHWLQRPWGGY